MHDVTYKIFASDWGLWRLALHGKHWDDRGLPRSTLWTVAYGVIPKEKKEMLSELLEKTFQIHANEGRHLKDLIHQVHADEGLGGRAAVQETLPKARWMCDVRHKTQSIIKSNRGGSKSIREWAASQLEFGLKALQWSRGLFHHYIDAMMGRLIELGELDLVDYLGNECCYQSIDGVWRCHCRTHCSLTKMDVRFGTDEVAWPIHIVKGFSNEMFCCIAIFSLLWNHRSKLPQPRPLLVFLL